MEYSCLGKTGIEVSSICFGTLTVGPLQANMPLERGAEVLAAGVEGGINFFDSAQLYGTYPYIRRAMELTKRFDLVVSTKTYAYSRELAKAAVDDARKSLNRDYVDIFMLHEQESALTLRGHREALDYLLECKQRGIVKAVGASMHHIAAVKGAADLGLDVIHPLLNWKGLGIVDGSRYEMEQAIEAAHVKGIGVFAMKALGGGNLFKSAAQCLEYIRGLPYVDAVAVGMQSVEEVDANLDFWREGSFSPARRQALDNKVRRLHVDDWCEGCGACVEACPQGALSLEDGQAACDFENCVLCSYCAGACPAWAIKVV